MKEQLDIGKQIIAASCKLVDVESLYVGRPFAAVSVVIMDGHDLEVMTD